MADAAAAAEDNDDRLNPIPDLMQLLASSGVGVGSGNVKIEELSSSGGEEYGDSSCHSDENSDDDHDDEGHEEEEGVVEESNKIEAAKIGTRLLIAIAKVLPSAAQSVLTNPLATACASGNPEMLGLLLSNQMFCARDSMRVLMSLAAACPNEHVAFAMYDMIKSAAGACTLAISGKSAAGASAKKAEKRHEEEDGDEEDTPPLEFPACFSCLKLASAASAAAAVAPHSSSRLKKK